MRHCKKNKPTFAIVGLGFISTKHINAIENIGGELLAVVDNDKSKFDKVDKYVRTFTDLDYLLKDSIASKLDYIVIATPNNLHIPMIKKINEAGIKVICEKPVSISTRALDEIKDLDDVFVIHQLRYVEGLKDFKKCAGIINMNIHVRRDDWYFEGWKGDEQSSGGVMFNIGVHYFDLLCYLFGKPKDCSSIIEDINKKASGTIIFNKKVVHWKIALDAPMDNQVRIIKSRDKKLNLTQGIEGLHNKAYQKIIAGNGICPSELINTTKLIETLSIGAG